MQRTYQMFNKLLFGLAVFLVFANSHAAIKAMLNQRVVYEGDPVQLTIESDRKLPDQPGLSVLDKDFTVQGTSEGTSFSMVNGNTSFSQTWTITLLPKRKGELTIPSIQVGSESTLPIILTVADITPELRAKNREHVTLEATVDIGKSLPYVQQQIPYTLKLHTDETVRQGDIFEPNIENAIIEKISKDKQYGIVRNGKKINVLERHYVISPEKSGKLIIPPAIFKGKKHIVSKNSGGSRRGAFDDLFNDPFFGNPFGDRGEPITTRSDSIEIAVQTIPDNYNGENWLPAEDLIIIDSWEKELPVFRVGEPVVRTLILQAKGLAGSQIPKFIVPKPNNIRTYPDQEKAQTKSDGMTIYGLLQQSVSYIPNAEGKFIIPAIKVDWWDVVASEQKTFTVPSHEISVLSGGAGSEQNTEEQASVDSTLASEEPVKQSTTDNQEPTVEKSNKGHVTWILLVLSLGMFGTYYIYKSLKQRMALNKTTDKHEGQTEPRVRTRQILTKLQQACNSSDNEEAAKLLLKLAKKQWTKNPPQSLGALAKRLASGTNLIKELDESLYAVSNGDNKSWDGSLLWGAFKQGLKPIEVNQSLGDDGLAASLYPNR